MYAVTDTSRDAIASISLGKRKTLADEIEQAIAQRCKAGAKDVSMREVQQVLERNLGRRVEMSTISGRVNELVAAKRVVRDLLHKRTCSVTGAEIHALSVMPGQRRMFA